MKAARGSAIGQLKESTLLREGVDLTYGLGGHGWRRAHRGVDRREDPADR